MNPGKWNQRLKHAVPWWFYFDSYPFLYMQPEDFKVGAQVAPQEFVLEEHVARIDPLSHVEDAT